MPKKKTDYKEIRIKPAYKPLIQMKYCCECCSIQWILLRRGLKWIDQEELAKYLGVRVPKKVSHLFTYKIKTSQKSTEWGTPFSSKKTAAKITKFFKSHKIPLHASWHPIGSIENPVEFISTNLKKGNDLMIIFHWRGLGKRKKSWNIGHVCVVSGIKLDKKPSLILGDPSQNQPNFWECDLGKLIKSMDKKYDYERGFYLVQPI